MNRVLKRPMFRMGGSSGTGITSGLDKPRQQYRTAGTVRPMPDFSPSGIPGFLTSFGLNLLAQRPQGNIFATAATAAQEPFKVLQAQQASTRKTLGEREFLRSEREAGDKAAMERLKIKLQSDKDIAAMGKENALYQVSLDSYIEDGLPPLAAERAATFATTKADELRTAVGGTRYGGVLNFDIRDPNNQKQIRKNLAGKVVYDPIENNYKYIVVRDGEVFFDEFDFIKDIKFPDLTDAAPKQKTERSNTMFGLDMDDPQA